MKSLKNFIALMISVFIFNNLMGQIHLGPAIGINIAKCSFASGTGVAKSDNKSILMPDCGVLLDIKFPFIIGIQTGLFYSGKGTNIEGTYQSQVYFGKYKPSYLEIPVHILFQKSVFRFYLGPYISYGIGGKHDYNDGMANNKDKIKFEKSVSETDYSNFTTNHAWYMNSMDYGLDIGVGLKLKKISFNAGYSLGLTNLTPSIQGVSSSFRKDNRYTNNAWVFTLGYYLLNI